MKGEKELKGYGKKEKGEGMSRRDFIRKVGYTAAVAGVSSAHAQQIKGEERMKAKEGSKPPTKSKLKRTYTSKCGTA